MADPRLEIGEVEMSFANAGDDTARMERIAELTFAYLQEMMRPLQHLDLGRVIEHIEVPDVPVSLDTMDDDAIARASASEIHRSLLQALYG
jgi:hypothetical protein